MKIKLDLFHAVQRVTSTLDKRHPLFRSFCDDLRGTFRREGDSGSKRTMSTPDSDKIEANLKSLVRKWSSVEALLLGKPLMNHETRKAISNLLRHVEKGCLSAIPVGYSTGMNENLHKNLNRFLKGLKMGPELAANMLMLFFFVWNNKKAISSSGKRIYENFSKRITGREERGGSKEKACSQRERVLENQVHTSIILDENHLLSLEFQGLDSFLTKYHLYKRLKAQCQIESLTFEIFFDSSRFYGLFCKSPVKPSAELQLEKRARNFGFSSEPVIRLPGDREDNILSVLAISVVGLIIDSQGNNHYECFGATGLSQDISTNVTWMLDKVKEKKMNFCEADSAKVIQVIANALGMSIVCLLSSDTIPLIPFYPSSQAKRNCLLYIGCLHGQWKKLTKNLSRKVPTFLSAETSKLGKTKRSVCCCGSKEQDPSKKCTKVEGAKYASKCPCLKEKRSCETCDCKGCENPAGRPIPHKMQKHSRKRAPSQLQPSFTKSKDFLLQKGEDISSPTWSLDESLLLRHCMEVYPDSTSMQGTMFATMALQLCRKGFHIGKKTARQIKAKGDFLIVGQREATARMVVSKTN